MTAPDDRTMGQVPAEPPRSQLEGLGKRKKKPKAPKPDGPSRKQRRAAAREQAPVRTGPSAPKLIAAVALIVALDILLFFAVGYALGKQIL